MSDKLIDVRTPLAMTDGVRVELGQNGELHVVTPSLTLHLERQACERLTNTLARAGSLAQDRSPRCPPAATRRA